MYIILQFVILSSLCSPITAISSTSQHIKVTFVRLKSTSIEAYCSTIHTQRTELSRCATICADRNKSCSAIEYTNNDCTLWKYVVFERNASPLENLYLKDVDNKFKNSDCVQEKAVTDLGKQIQKFIVNL